MRKTVDISSVVRWVLLCLLMHIKVYLVFEPLKQAIISVFRRGVKYSRAAEVLNFVSTNKSKGRCISGKKKLHNIRENVCFIVVKLIPDAINKCFLYPFFPHIKSLDQMWTSRVYLIAQQYYRYAESEYMALMMDCQVLYSAHFYTLCCIILNTLN